MSLHTSSLPAYLYNNVHASGRKRRTAVPQIPNQTDRENITQLSDHRRSGNKHINHIPPTKHRTHQLTRSRLTVRQVLRLTQEVFPGNISLTLQISPLTKKILRLHRNKTFTSSLDRHRFVLFFLLLSLPLFSLFFSFSLSFSFSFFFTFLIFT